MRKIKFIVVSLLLVLAFTNCDKEIESTRTVVDTTNPDRMATITLKGYADLNNKEFGDEKVPDSTRVLFSANKSDFITSATGKLQLEFQFKDGVLVAEVPTTDAGVTYTITPIDFEYNTTVNPIVWKASSLLMRYTATSTSQNVLIGETKAQNITYIGKNADITYTEWVEVSGEISGEFDEEDAGYDKLDENVKLVFYNSSKTWYKEVQTDGTNYTVSVPKSEFISCDYNFSYEKNVLQSDASYDEDDYTYTGTISLGAFYSNSDSDFNVGVGVEE